jgi:hypothetical protein
VNTNVNTRFLRIGLSTYFNILDYAIDWI